MFKILKYLPGFTAAGLPPEAFLAFGLFTFFAAAGFLAAEIIGKLARVQQILKVYPLVS